MKITIRSILNEMIVEVADEKAAYTTAMAINVLNASVNEFLRIENEQVLPASKS
jgi:hypothetical protein